MLIFDIDLIIYLVEFSEVSLLILEVRGISGDTFPLLSFYSLILLLVLLLSLIVTLVYLA